MIILRYQFSGIRCYGDNLTPSFKTIHLKVRCNLMGAYYFLKMSVLCCFLQGNYCSTVMFLVVFKTTSLREKNGRQSLGFSKRSVEYICNKVDWQKN